MWLVLSVIYKRCTVFQPQQKHGSFQYDIPNVPRALTSASVRDMQRDTKALVTQTQEHDNSGIWYGKVSGYFTTGLKFHK